MTHLKNNKPVYDLNEIKIQAKKSIGHRSVTHDYPLNIEEACQLLNSALASEIMCVLR